jgi:hypothetical protein
MFPWRISSLSAAIASSPVAADLLFVFIINNFVRGSHGATCLYQLYSPQ